MKLVDTLVRLLLSFSLAKKDNDVPPPDPSIGEAQRRMADLAERQQTWYETNVAPSVLNQMQQNTDIAKRVADSNLQVQDFQTGLMRQYNDRYWNTQVPLEDQLISQARSYNEPAEQEKMAGTAGADVEQAFNTSNQDLQRSLSLRGINGSSPAAIAAMSASADNKALAKAGAMNKTREAARQLGWTRLGEAAALGKGLPSFGSTSASLATGAGSGAVGAGQAGMGAAGAAAGVNASQTSSLGNLWGNYGNLGLGLYNAQVQGSKSNDSAGGWMAGIGGIMQGAGAMGWSSKKLKNKRADVTDADVLDSVNKLNVDEWSYKPGVADSGTHIGPYAEDVQREFGDDVAPGGKMIDLGKSRMNNGRAIRALAAEIQRMNRELAQLQVA